MNLQYIPPNNETMKAKEAIMPGNSSAKHPGRPTIVE